MKKFLLFFSDAVLLYASLLLMLYIRHKDNFAYQYHLHILSFASIFVLYLLVFYIANLYEFKTLRNNIYFYSVLFQATIIASGISVLFFYFLPFYGITPKTNLIIFIAIFAGLEIVNRSIFNGLVEKRFKKSVLIVGADDQALELAKFIKENPQLGYELKHIIDLASGAFHDAENIGHTIKEGKINIVVLGPEAYRLPDIIDTFYKSLEYKITFVNLSSFYENLTGRVALGAINQIWFLENLNEGNKKAYEIVKHAFDLIFSVVMGILSLLFYPFVILAIKLYYC